MVEIKLSFNSPVEAINFLAAAVTGGQIAAASAMITPEKQQAARDSTAAGKAEKAAKAPTPSPAPVPEKAAGPDRADVSAKIVKLAGLDQDAAVALLASFNVKRAKELTDDQLADALVAADKALATADMG